MRDYGGETRRLAEKNGKMYEEGNEGSEKRRKKKKKKKNWERKNGERVKKERVEEDNEKKLAISLINGSIADAHIVLKQIYKKPFHTSL